MALKPKFKPTISDKLDGVNSFIEKLRAEMVSAVVDGKNLELKIEPVFEDKFYNIKTGVIYTITI